MSAVGLSTNLCAQRKHPRVWWILMVPVLRCMFAHDACVLMAQTLLFPLSSLLKMCLLFFFYCLYHVESEFPAASSLLSFVCGTPKCLYLFWISAELTSGSSASSVAATLWNQFETICKVTFINSTGLNLFQALLPEKQQNLNLNWAKHLNIQSLLTHLFIFYARFILFRVMWMPVLAIFGQETGPHIGLSITGTL